jgi:hypothetical protein
LFQNIIDFLLVFLWEVFEREEFLVSGKFGSIGKSEILVDRELLEYSETLEYPSYPLLSSLLDGGIRDFLVIKQNTSSVALGESIDQIE